MGGLTDTQRKWLSHLAEHIGAGIAKAAADSDLQSRGLVAAAPLNTASPHASATPSTKARFGPRSATLELRWAEDADQFYSRVLSALEHDAAFKGISADQFNAVSSNEPQSLIRLVADFHDKYAMHHSDRREGQKLTVAISAEYSPNPEMWGSSLSGKKIALVEHAAAAKPTASNPPSTAAPGSGAISMLAHMAAEADHGGWAGISFMVKSDGRTPVVSSMEKVGPQAARPQGVGELSQDDAARELAAFMANAAESKGKWEGNFGRDPKSGAMHFLKWSKGPDEPRATGPAAPHHQRTKAEEFEQEVGGRYPPRINKALHDIAAEKLKEANPFSLKSLPYTIAGVVVPMGAMKFMMMDANELGAIVRIEWQLDETVIEEAAEARQAEGPSGASVPSRDLKPGDVIDTPDHGQQRVVEVTSKKIVTEPYAPDESPSPGAGAKPKETPPPPPPPPPAPPPRSAPKTPANNDIKPIEGHTAKDVLSDYPAKKHVFEGNEDGGYHSTARPTTNTQLEIIENPRRGVYKIKVEIRKPDGSLIKTKDSTMFPDNLSEKQVLDEVYEVMLEHKTTPLPEPNAKGIIVIEGKSPAGYSIKIYLGANGDSQVLLTFYPKR